MADGTYGCEYCNGRVEYEVRGGIRYCLDCGSALCPEDDHARLMMM